MGSSNIINFLPLIVILLISPEPTAGKGKSFLPMFRSGDMIYGCNTFLTGDNVCYTEQTRFEPSLMLIDNDTEDNYDNDTDVAESPNSQFEPNNHNEPDDDDIKNDISDTTNSVERKNQRRRSSNNNLKKRVRKSSKNGKQKRSFFSFFNSYFTGGDSSQSSTGIHLNDKYCLEEISNQNNSGIYKKRIVFQCCAKYKRNGKKCSIDKDLKDVQTVLDNLVDDETVRTKIENEIKELKNFTLFLPANTVPLATFSKSKNNKKRRGRKSAHKLKRKTRNALSTPENISNSYYLIGNQYQPSYLFYDGLNLLTTSPGDANELHLSSERCHKNLWYANCVPIVRTDQFAGNGVIHILNGSLPQLSDKNIREELENYPDLTKFVAHMKKSGIFDKLTSDSKFSVIGIPNDAFDSFPKTFLTKLDNNDKCARDWLRSLIVPGFVCLKSNNMTVDDNYHIKYYKMASNGVINVVSSDKINIPDQYLTPLEILNFNTQSSEAASIFKEYLSNSSLTIPANVSLAVPDDSVLTQDSKNMEALRQGTDSFLKNHLFANAHPCDKYLVALSGKKYRNHRAGIQQYIQCSKANILESCSKDFYAQLDKPLLQFESVNNTKELSEFLRQVNSDTANISNFLELLEVPKVVSYVDELFDSLNANQMNESDTSNTDYDFLLYPGFSQPIEQGALTIRVPTDDVFTFEMVEKYKNSMSRSADKRKSRSFAWILSAFTGQREDSDSGTLEKYFKKTYSCMSNSQDTNTNIALGPDVLVHITTEPFPNKLYHTFFDI